MNQDQVNILKIARGAAKRYRQSPEYDELISEGVVKIISNKDKFKEGAGLKLGSFYYRLAIQGMADYFKRKCDRNMIKTIKVGTLTTPHWGCAKEHETDKPFLKTTTVTDGDYLHPEKFIQKQDLIRYILDTASKILSDKELTILKLFYVDNKKITEVAGEIGISKYLCRQICHRAIQKLKAVIL
jgi:RNA polymerase sigma factor (sigma-70 family)